MIVVAGSLNMDLVVRVSRFPHPGETLMGREFGTMAGGKGGNQAYAAARLGAKVRMVGRVGDDAFAKDLVDGLRSASIDVSTVQSTARTPSGIALITVDDSGQNHIVVATGANAHFSADDAEAGLADVEGGYLLIQLESPEDTITAIIRAAKGKGMTIILDPAPARPLSRDLLGQIDILTPNQSEAMTLLGKDGAVSLEDAPQMTEALGKLGVGSVVLKLGEHGAMIADGHGTRHHTASRTNVVDTTAAGDTFNGALAVALSEGRTIDQAVAFANVAAALSVSRRGAQASMPTRAEVEDGMLN